MAKTGGEPKPVAHGKKGNVGGIATPGRKGHMIKALTMLVKPGPATKKTPAIANLHRPEGAVSIDAGAVKAGSGKAGPAAGSPKDISAGSGHKGIHVGTGASVKVSHDEHGAIAHKK